MIIHATFLPAQIWIGVQSLAGSQQQQNSWHAVPGNPTGLKQIHFTLVLQDRKGFTGMQPWGEPLRPVDVEVIACIPS